MSTIVLYSIPSSPFLLRKTKYLASFFASKQQRLPQREAPSLTKQKLLLFTEETNRFSFKFFEFFAI